MSADEACSLRVDGEEVGAVKANEVKRLSLAGGEHLVQAYIGGSVVWSGTVEIHVGAQKALVVATKTAPPPAAPTGSLLISVDANALVSVDGKEIGSFSARVPQNAAVGLGQHLVTARSGDVSVESLVEVKVAAQQVVSLALAAEMDRRRAADDERRRREMDAAARRTLDAATAKAAAADSLFKAERWSEAAALLQQAVALYPDNARWQTDLGIALDRQRKYEEAEAPYRAAVRLEPQTAQWHYNLGWLLDVLNKNDEAANEYARAVSLAPQNAGWHSAYGGVLSSMNRLTDAEREYREAIRLDASQPTYRTMLASTLNQRGQWTAAEAEYRQAIAAAPKNANPRASLASFLAGQERWVDVQKEAVDGLALAPDHVLLRSQLARAYREMEKWSQAEAEYRALVANAAPPTWIYHVNAAEFFRERRRFPEAEAFNKQAIDRAPVDPIPHFELGLTLMAAGRQAEADAAFAAAISRALAFPASEAARGYGVATRLIRSDIRLTDAAQIMQRALEASPADAFGTYHAGLGWAQLKLGHLDDAERNLKVALASRETTTTLDRLAEVSLKLGKRDDAKRHWERALAITSPTTKLAGEIRAKLQALATGTK